MNNIEIIKEKRQKINNLNKEYQKKLELLKQHYLIDFNIDYTNSKDILRIKFINLTYKNLKNICLIYDNILEKNNYLEYDYDGNDLVNYINSKKIIDDIFKEKKLDLVIADIKRNNKNYLLELKKIENRNG